MKYFKFLIIGVSLLSFNTVFSQNLKIPSGKSLSVRLEGHVDSKGKSNNAVGFVNGDVYNNDNQLVIKNGSSVMLSVEVQKAKGVGKPGSILVKTISTLDVNGNVVPLTGYYSAEGEEKKGLALGLGIGLGLTLLPGWGFFFLCIKGKNVVMPQSTPIMATIL